MRYNKRWRFWRNVLGTVIVLSALCSSQSLAQLYTLQRLSVEDGLSQSVVQALYQDTDGYIWVGTQAGLNRYDGAYFQHFGIDAGLPSDYINDIIGSSENTLWIATNNGVAHWSPASGFTAYGTESGLPDAPIYRLATDASGTLWVGTGNGLAYWDGSRFHPLTLQTTAPTAQINSLAFDAGGHLWVGTTDGLWVSTSEPNGRYEQRSAETVMALRPNAQEQMWVAFREHVEVYHNNAQIHRFDASTQLTDFPIQDLIHSRDGTTLVLTLTGLTIIEEGIARPVNQYHTRPFLVGLRLIEDYEGNIWLGSIQGLTIWSNRAFTTYREGHGLPSNVVRPILRDSQGTLWVGTRQGLRRFKGPDAKTFREPDGLTDRFVRALYEDQRGRLWIGTYTRALYYENDRFYEVTLPNAEDIRPFSFIEDTDGRIWIAGHRGGIFRQTADGRFEKVTVEGQIFGNPRLLAASDGRIWASGDRGLSVWNGSRWHTYTTENGLAANAPYFMAEDSQGRIWFGYHGAYGVSMFDGTIFHTYTTKDGLTSNNIYSVGIDAEDNVWLGSASGVDKFDGERVLNYGPADGFADTEANAGGFFLDVDSTLWFGTMGGLSHYQPKKDLLGTQPPRVHLAEATLGGEPIPSEMEDLRVPFAQNDFHVRVAILSFANPKTISWRYRLEGHDDAWRTRDGRDIDYTNLRAGTYTLTVEAKRKNSDWSQAALLSFEIEPPFWQTIWFALLALWGFGGLIIGIVRFRVRHAEARSRELEAIIQERTAELQAQKSQVEHTLNEVQALKADLEQANTELIEADRLKSQFLANMSHEIRTPMNGVLGMTEVLLGMDLDDEQRNCTEVIHRSGEALLTIINDILDFSKMEAGKLELEHVPFNLHEVIEDSVELFTARAERKGLNLIGWLDDGPPQVLGDPHRLRQIVTNLVSNAIKFTEHGDVIVRTQQRPLDEQRVQWQISVQDTGIGIPEEARSRLFRSFAQVDGSTTRRFGGTGLGLAISKQLVEMMGGRIDVESTVHEGSTFTITLPLVPAPLAAEPALPTPLAGKRILVAVDHPVRARMLRAYLTAWQMRPTLVTDTPTLQETWERQAHQTFDLCLFEPHLLAAVPAVATSTRWQRLPKIQLGAHLERQQTDRQGMLWKPIRRNVLRDVVQAVLNDQIKRSTQHNKQERPIDTKGHILLVEDNAMNQRVAQFHLDALGYSFDLAENGKEAVDALDEASYDIILMDVHMPLLDGFEATAAIRARPDEHRTTPIIAMTANAMIGERTRCLEQGMNDYLSKPFKREILRAMLDKWMAAGDRTSPMTTGDGAAAHPTETT